MNINVTKAIYFTAGLCIGGGTAYLLVKDRYRKLVEEEVESVKETYQKIYEVKLRKVADDWLAAQPAEEESPEKNAPQVQYGQVVEDSGYSTVSNEEPEAVVASVEIHVPDEVEDFEVTVTTADEEVRDPSKPYEIDAADYYSNDEFDQIVLTYWVPEGLLVDEREEPVDDQDETIGVHHIAKLAVMPGNSTIYVRNENLQVDFEILRNPQSYKELVMNSRDWGSVDEEKLKEVKKMRSDGS